MALPPTRLTVLLNSTPHAPANLIVALERHGLLSPEALADRKALSRFLAGAIEIAEARPPIPGPTASDLLAQSLRTAGHLSLTGLTWFQAAPSPEQMPRGTSTLQFLGIIGLRPLLQGLFALSDSTPLTVLQWIDFAFGWLTLLVAVLVWTRRPGRERWLLIYGAIGIGWSLTAPFLDPPPLRVFSIAVAITTAAVIGLMIWRESRQLQVPERAG